MNDSVGEQQHPKESGIQRTLVKLCRHKKMLGIVSAGVLLLVAIGGYAWWSAAQWQYYSDVAKNRPREVKEMLLKQLGSTGATPATIVTLSKEVKKAKDEMCNPPALTGWQAGAKPLRETIKSCEASQEELAAVYQSLEALKARLADEKSLTDILDETYIKLEKTDKNDYVKLRALWSDAGTKIESTSVHASLTQTKKQLQAAIKEIQDALTKLEEANKAESRADFDAATEEVTKAYGKIAGVQAASTESYRELIEGVVDSAQKL